ncbi:hypothetical protein OSTOST_07646 [Ostertagia ostertagi]
MFVLGLFSLVLGVAIGRSMAQRVTSSAERALRIVEKSSRVRIQDLRDNVGARTSGRQVTKRANQASFGADDFAHKIDIEVQYASQTAISAVEKAGGRIRVAYYDPDSLQAAVDPKAWFMSGHPVPARKAPPPSLLEYYRDPSNRGYLAETAELVDARKRLALVMGYDIPDSEISIGEKGPTQVFHGIPPGAVVSLADRKVFLPTHPVVKDYYQKSFVADKQFP